VIGGSLNGTGGRFSRGDGFNGNGHLAIGIEVRYDSMDEGSCSE